MNHESDNPTHPQSDVVDHLKKHNRSLQPATELASPEEKAAFIVMATNRFRDTWCQVQKGMSSESGVTATADSGE